MERVIDIMDLRKSFEEKSVLKGLNLHLNKNENVALLGRSGSGKSVLLKSIVGLIDADEGKINVLGHEVTSSSEEELIQLRREVGYVFQESALYDSMDVEDNISFSLKRQKNRKSNTEIKVMVMDALDKVGLLDAINKMPSELSGGMKKRVALARTLVLQPSIILYDEPTAGLDPVTSKEIIRLMLDMKLIHGISSIIATHDLICTKMAADRIVVLNNGVIQEEGNYEELENSNIESIRSFFI